MRGSLLSRRADWGDACLVRCSLRKRIGRSRSVIIASGTAICLLLFPAMHKPLIRLVWNVSASVPVGLYQVVPGVEVRRGVLVAVRPPQPLVRYMASRHYVEAGALLVKPVAAIAGQQVCRSNNSVTIDGVNVATARATDRGGRPLLVWSGCRRLGLGTVFLLAPKAPASFDGRYFGTIAVSNIVGRAMPVWTW